MTSTHETRFAAFFAAVACAIITIGLTVAPAVTPVSGLIA
jgi:hypothetical protein